MPMMYKPIKVFLPPALAVLGVGTVKVVFDVVTKDFRLATNTLALLLGALGVLVVGLLADLIVQLNKDHNVVDPAAFYVGEPNGQAEPIRDKPDSPAAEFHTQT